MTELKKVCEDNIWKIVKLSVRPDQESFVATNTQSILEAYITITEGHVALPFGIYEDGTLIGFVMFGYGRLDGPDEPPVADGNYALWRFMIDKDYQGKGFGKAALAEALNYLRTQPCGSAKKIWTSYEPENTVARALYLSAGFVENGQMCGDETVAEMDM